MRICVSCGRRAEGRPLNRLPIAVSPDMGICDTCKDRLSRKGVKSGIQRESDRILSEHPESLIPYMPQPTCKHCGGIVLYDKQGRQPMWCGSCERRRMQIATGVNG